MCDLKKKNAFFVCTSTRTSALKFIRLDCIEFKSPRLVKRRNQKTN